MSKLHEAITPELAAWIEQQQMFFVGTAPLDANGHVNISPKGGEAFKIINPVEVVYQDYTGSGAETAAHIQENGRIVIMFCAFAGPPQILRLHGHGTLITPNHPRYAELAAYFPPNAGTRAYIHIAVSRIADSCGYSVPFYEFQAQRDILDRWASSKKPEQLAAYRAEKNQQSIDGLPAFNIH